MKIIIIQNDFGYTLEEPDQGIKIDSTIYSHYRTIVERDHLKIQGSFDNLHWTLVYESQTESSGYKESRR